MTSTQLPPDLCTTEPSISLEHVPPEYDSLPPEKLQDALSTDDTDESSESHDKGFSSRARGILDRLSRLEQSQTQMMATLKTDHQIQMEELRDKLEQAEQRRREADSVSSSSTSVPFLMEVNMTEVEAAVQAASFAEQESAMALEEARKVAEEARLSAGGIPESTKLATKEGDIAFGADSEYIVKKVSVNLDEVERAISNSPLIRVCRAFGRPDTIYGNQVYCAVVPRTNVRVSEPMLNNHAQKYLPTAMVPKRFYFLDDLPSGITRKALADAQMMGDATNKPFLAAIEN